MKKYLFLLGVITLFSMPIFAQTSAGRQYIYRYQSGQPLSIPANKFILSHTFESGYGTIVVTSPVLSDSTLNFSWETSLKALYIPEGVTSIGDGAFSDCSGLTSITIPNSVTSIGDMAFSYCKSLTSITIPNSVTWIGDGAFRECNGLSTITISAITPPEINDLGIIVNNNSLRFRVPMNSLRLYKKAPGWKSYSDFIVGF